jgi:hypothetical protein
MKTMTILALAATAGAASALNLQATEYTGTVLGQTQQLLGDPTGSTFFYSSGVGSAAGGFALAIPMAADAVVGATTIIGTDLTGGTVSVESTVVDNGGGNFDVTMRMFTDGADLSPGGFTTGGVTADTAGVFMGGNGGGTPFQFSDTAITNSAEIELIGAAGSIAGPFDISAFGNFTADNGGWDGGFGVTFGAGSAGLGITEYVFTGNFTVVPAPGAMAIAGLGGLVATRRRR